MLDAAFALNEGAGGELDKNEKPVALEIQAGEKVYQDFALDASDVGDTARGPPRTTPSYVCRPASPDSQPSTFR